MLDLKRIFSDAARVDSERIAAAELERSPFPHFVADGVLSEAELAALEANWPAPERFAEGGQDGNYLFDFSQRIAQLPEAQQAFWRGFLRGPASGYLQAAAGRFAPWFAAKYGELLSQATCWCMLQEMGPEFAGHEIHNHHYHGPTWLFSTLLYLEDARELPGTSLYRIAGRDLGEVAATAALTLQWQDLPEVVLDRTIEFRRNRLFAFLDGPISLHGVGRPPAGAARGRRRRAIRIHVMARAELVEPVYGMRPAKYDVLRRRASREPQVIDLLQREIAQMLAVDPATRAAAPSISAEP